MFLAKRDGFPSDALVKFDNSELPKEVLPDVSELLRRRTDKDFHPTDPADQQPMIARKFLGCRRHTVEKVDQHVRIDARRHAALFPLPS